jgi:hypothetical protein
MYARCCVDYAAHFALVQLESCLLKFFLHVSMAKETPTGVSRKHEYRQTFATYKSPPLRALLQSDSVVASSDSDFASGPVSPASYALIWA